MIFSVRENTQENTVEYTENERNLLTTADRRGEPPTEGDIQLLTTRRPKESLQAVFCDREPMAH